MTRRWRTAAPGLILLALVILTVVLLLAGYGVPVGVGLLAGLVLGGVVGLFSGLWLGVRGRGRSMTIGSMNISPLEEGAPTEMPEIFRDIGRVQRVDHGGLVRVIPGGAVADAGGVAVELIALEIRAAGAVAHLAAAVEPPNGTLGSFARVSVEDDLGTAYVAAAMGTSGSPTGCGLRSVSRRHRRRQQLSCGSASMNSSIRTRCDRSQPLSVLGP